MILFLGDGMSIPTLAAARVYVGQLTGNSGEETVLSFEDFPNTGLSKVRKFIALYIRLSLYLLCTIIDLLCGFPSC